MTTSAEEYNAEGNKLLEQGLLDQAVAQYTKGIEAYPDDYELYSNRSAAYHANGDGFRSLQDAKKCLQLNPNFSKGYARKAEALHYLKRYREAVKVYEQGLEKFPGDDTLTAALEDLQIEQSATLAARGQRASMIASLSAQRNSKQAETLSDYVVMMRSMLEFDIAAKQAQLRILNQVSKKSDEEKMTLLFNILDKNGDGYISAQELSDGVRKRNADFSFGDSIDRAMDMVALFDKDKDAKLSPEEFKTFVKTMLENVEADFHEFAEYLIMQMLFMEGNDIVEEVIGLVAEPEIEQEVKERGEYYNALVDQRMKALFQLFDLDGDGSVDFCEVALGMYQLTHDLETSVEGAMAVLLTYDQSDDRTLSYTEFAQLMLNIAASSGKKFDEIADALTLAMCQDQFVSEEDIAVLAVTDALFTAALDQAQANREAIETMGALQYAKLHKLFDLWDTDKDGYISFDELLVGMRRFQDKMDIEESAQRAALVMIGYDSDGNQKLDRIEFAVALVEYAKSVKADVLDLIDFMCVATVLVDDDEFEKAFVKAITPIANQEIAAIENQLDK